MPVYGPPAVTLPALRRPRLRPLIVACGVALGALLGACGGPDEIAQLAAARRHISEGEAAKAVIEMKSLLQKRPGSADARFLLGRALLADGDAAGAEAELRRSRERRWPDDEAVPVLALALLGQGKEARLIEEFGAFELKGDDARADLKSSIALAHASSGQLDRALQTADAALAIRPQHAPALLLRARLLAVRGDGAAARRIADELVQREPNNELAWSLKGDLLQGPPAPDDEAALAAYRRALALKPRTLAAHGGLMQLLIRQGRLDDARKQQEAMAQALPEHGATLYYEGALAYLRGDPRRAREVAQALLVGSPSHPRVLVLGALAELQLGGAQQAVAMLEKSIAAAPAEGEPRHLLARVHLRENRPERALDTLRPLMTAGSSDFEAYTLAAQAQLLAGDSRQSELSLARAAQIQPGDPAVRTAIARSMLARGQFEPGLRELQSAAAADTEGRTADLALISTHLRRNELDAAMKAADALARKQPRLAMADHLRGHIAVLQRKEPAARVAFESALTKDPGYLPSLARLAELDLADHRVAAARRRYEALLERQPDHVAALLALAALVRRSGGTPAEVAGWLDKATQVRPRDVTTWLAAIDLQLQSGHAADAAARAGRALAAVPGHADLLQRQAIAQLADGKPKLALTTLSQLEKAAPKNAALHLLYASAHAADNDEASAALQVQSALALAPDSQAAQRSGVELALRRGRAAEALALARDVQLRFPAEAIGLRLEGDAEAGQQRWDAAAAAYAQAATKRNPADAAIRSHWALLRARREADAARYAQARLKEQPDDVAFIHHLGEMALLAQDWAGAEARFRAAIERQPDHPSALNNLAYLTLKAGKPGALALAERAARAAPDQPEVLDTLAQALAQAGRGPEAIERQRRAVALAPDSGGLRLNLARLYLAAGDTARARAELEPLARRGTSFSAHAEVAELLKAGSGR